MELENNMKREMKYSLDGKYLNNNNILQLMESCNKLFKHCNLEIYFKNNEKQSNITFEEFKNYDFSNLTIDSISLSCYSYIDEEKSIYLRKNIYGKNYYIIFSSDNDNSFYNIKGIIDDWMRKITSKNSFVMKFVNSLKIYFLIYLIYSFSIALSTFYLIDKNNIGIPYSIIISSVGGVLITFLSNLTISILRYMFPMTEIDIGENKSKNLRKYIWSIILIIIIPTIFLVLGLFIKV